MILNHAVHGVLEVHLVPCSQKPCLTIAITDLVTVVCLFLGCLLLFILVTQFIYHHTQNIIQAVCGCGDFAIIKDSLGFRALLLELYRQELWKDRKLSSSEFVVYLLTEHHQRLPYVQVDFGFGIKRMAIGRWEQATPGLWLSVVNLFAFIRNILLDKQCPWPNVLLELERMRGFFWLTESFEEYFLIQLVWKENLYMKSKTNGPVSDGVQTKLHIV